MTIKPIKTEEDYKAALAEINRLFDAHEGTEDFDRLDLLATLVEVYEAKHCFIAPPSPLAAIEYEMEKRGLSRRDLEPILGPGGRVGEVLDGRRPLTMTMIRRLHSHFNLSADVLIAPYPLQAGRPVKRAKARAGRSLSSPAARHNPVTIPSQNRPRPARAKIPGTYLSPKA